MCATRTASFDVEPKFVGKSRNGSAHAKLGGVRSYLNARKCYKHISSEIKSLKVFCDAFWWEIFDEKDGSFSKLGWLGLFL